MSTSEAARRIARALHTKKSFPAKETTARLRDQFTETFIDDWYKLAKGDASKFHEMCALMRGMCANTLTAACRTRDDGSDTDFKELNASDVQKLIKKIDFVKSMMKKCKVNATKGIAKACKNGKSAKMCKNDKSAKTCKNKNKNGKKVICIDGVCYVEA